MSETPQDHEHDLVWVTSPGEEQARQYCRDCGYRSAWQDLPPELKIQPTDLVDMSEADGYKRAEANELERNRTY